MAVDAECRVVVSGASNTLLGHPCETAPIPAGEEVIYTVYNLTFHRPSHHGLVLTNRALYVYRPILYYIRRWRRIAIETITDVAFVDSNWKPALYVRALQGTTIFRAPSYDGDDEEMEFNRDELRRTVQMIDAAQTNLRELQVRTREA